MDRGETAKQIFLSGYNCAQSLVLAYEDLIPVEHKTLLRLASPFGGGMGRLREVCGAVSGMFLVAGFLYGYDEAGQDTIKKALYARVNGLGLEFEKRRGTLLCRDLLGLECQHDISVPEKRTEHYYEVRPCPDLVKEAASILQEYIEKQ